MQSNNFPTLTPRLLSWSASPVMPVPATTVFCRGVAVGQMLGVERVHASGSVDIENDTESNGQSRRSRKNESVGRAA